MMVNVKGDAGNDWQRVYISSVQLRTGTPLIHPYVLKQTRNETKPNVTNESQR